MRVGREEAAEGEEEAALGVLAGQLTAAREGLRPVGAEELAAAAARLGADDSAAGHGSTDGQRQKSGNGASSASPLASFGRSLPGLLRMPSSMMLSVYRGTVRSDFVCMATWIAD